MKINLKKARKLEAKILSAILNGRVSLEARVRVQADINDVKHKMGESRTEAINAIENDKKLIDLRFKIRRAIAVENEASGINILISNKACLMAQRDLLNNYKSGRPALDHDELRDYLDQARKDLDKENSYMRNNSTLIDVNVFEDSDFEDLKDQHAQVMRDIESVDDMIAEKNYTSKITLDQADIDLLKLNKLI